MAGQLHADPTAPVLIRVVNFTVPPSTGPVGCLILKNTSAAPYEASVDLTLPDGWKGVLCSTQVVLPAEETVRIPFTIQRAVDVGNNRYPVKVTVTGKDGAVASSSRQIVCASAPYLKPKIDGNANDWADAIPVTFGARGRETTVSTAWNATHFAVCVQVEEDKLLPYAAGAKADFDALQFAIAPAGGETPRDGSAAANRYEFLVVSCPGAFARDKCFFLIKPDMPLSISQEPRPLEPLEMTDARIVVRRKGRQTTYECAIPWSVMPLIKPDTGREFCFSLLIHDPDGTGIRDLGEAAGLWPSQRNKYAWSLWPGARWPHEPPYDNRIEWGLCSSKH